LLKRLRDDALSFVASRAANGHAPAHAARQGAQGQGVTDEQQPGRWGAGRVAVMALADTIRADLKAGHSLAEIYRAHTPTLGTLTYERFRQLVTRIIGPVRAATSGARRPSALSQDDHTPPAPAKPRKR
jgi:hypothetical protein